MSKLPPDSDLYGDIYGDADDFTGDFCEIQELQETVPEVPDLLESPETAIASTSDSKSILPQTTINSLPAKPQITPVANMSYSAHVAKQFSAYKQTPSQERQQRADVGMLSSNSSSNATRNMVGHVAAGSFSNKGNVSALGDTVFGKKPSEMHDAGKLFVGGLSWDTTDEGLRDYFSKFGKVDACTIMRDPAGTSRGFAFLTFEDASAVDSVIGSEHILDGKNIDPKRAIPREEHLRNTRYFVGGLSPTTTSESMRRFFSTFGKVIDATVMVDRETGRGKGFGFVTFEDAVNSDQLVGKIGLMLDDKQIEVKAAQPRSQRDQTRASSSQSNGVSDRSMDPSLLAAPPVNYLNQPNPGLAMLNPRFLNTPLALMNPAMMGMGMNALHMGNNMLPGVNPMGLGMDGMFNMGNLATMRLGMGPIGTFGMGSAIPGFLRNTSQHGMSLGAMGGVGVSTTGPTRTARSHHGFHPYAR